MAKSLKQKGRELTNRLLRPIGLSLLRSDRVFEMEGILSRAQARGVQVGTWIDVGASDGQWSLAAARHFPASKFLLFEPLAERKAALVELKRTRGFDFVSAVAGREPGTVSFSVDPALDGSSVCAPGAAHAREVAVDSIDHAVGTRSLAGPYGIKLDAHGYEIAVLEGAQQTLRQAELLIIECYNYALTPETLRFPQLCAWLEERGFRCFDLADPMRRPLDGAFWQMDLAFAPAASPLFASARWI